MKIIRNNKILLIVIFIVLISLGFLIFSIITKDNVYKRLILTKTIKVTKVSTMEEKTISNKNDIKKIIKTLQNKKKMSKEDSIPYGIIPHYRLKFLSEKKTIITRIEFFYYNSDSNWILFSENDEYYKIDGDLLLKIIDF